MLDGIPMLPVDRSIAIHPVEKRGFVTVPLDHAAPDGPTVDIFYRLIPAYDSAADDSTRPIIVVINGGPGIAGSFYRPLDFDYKTHTSPRGFDRFKYLLKSYRILLADQRGTPGGSCPLDMDNPALNANQVARYFSSDSHALDYLAVIDAVIPEGEPYYIIAQSYGGYPGMYLLAECHQHGRRGPRGIVFSSSALPGMDPLDSWRHRRREQLKLNLELRQVVPDIEARIAETRAHLTAIGLETGLLNGLFAMLGKGVSGTWQPELVARLTRINGQTREAVLAEFKTEMAEPDLLNYILSSAAVSEGWTDRTLAMAMLDEIQFEPWMIDEHAMLMATGQDGGWRQALVDGMDAAPPPGTPMPPLDQLREAIAETHALFTAADNDAMVPAETYREAVSRFEIPGRTALKTIPGGHHAIFLEAGYATFVDWVDGLKTDM